MPMAFLALWKRLHSFSKKEGLSLISPLPTSQMTQWVKNSPANAEDTGDAGGFTPWTGKIPWRKKWQPTPVFLA